MKKESSGVKEGTFYFGAASRDITPVRPAWLDGYCGRKAVSGGVREPLSIGCLAVSDGKKTVLLICIDSLGIEHNICAELLSLLEKEVGITYPDVLLSCSHTHFAPTLRNDGFAGAPGYFVTPDPEYLEDFRVKIAEIAKESIRNMKPGRLETARTLVPQVHYNRRTRRRADGSVATSFLYPAKPEELEFRPVDSELTILRFRDDSGIRAVLVNFACHPVTGWGIRNVSEDMVSSEYPHYLRETIRSRYGCPVLFSLGAAGDVVPIDRLGDCRQMIGNILGNTAILADRQFQVDASAKLATATVTVKVNTRVKLDHVKTERDFAKLMSEHGPQLLDPGKPAGTQIYATPDWEKLAPVVAQAYQSRLYPDNSFEIPIQFIRIGGTVMVSLPFEVLSEIGLTMKAQFPNSVIVSCANGYHGYLPLAHEFKRGGYEVSTPAMHFAPDTGDWVLKAVLKKLRSF